MEEYKALRNEIALLRRSFAGAQLLSCRLRWLNNNEQGAFNARTVRDSTPPTTMRSSANVGTKFEHELVHVALHGVWMRVLCVCEKLVRECVDIGVLL